MECIIMTPLGDTVLDLSVEDIQELRARAIMKATPPGPAPVPTTPTTRTGATRLGEVASVDKYSSSKMDSVCGGGGAGTNTPRPGADHADHEDWGHPAPYYLHQDEGQEAWHAETAKRYSGFLIVKCEKCGKIHAFCSRFPGISQSKCAECGHLTKLDTMRPAYLRCDKCGREFKYRTNIQDTEFTIGCLNCNEQVTLRLGANGTAFVTPNDEGGGMA